MCINQHNNKKDIVKNFSMDMIISRAHVLDFGHLVPPMLAKLMPMQY